MDKVTFKELCMKTRTHVVENCHEFAGKSTKEILSLIESKVRAVFRRVDIDDLEALCLEVRMMYEKAHEEGLIDEIPTITGRYNEKTGEPEIIITHEQDIAQINFAIKTKHTENSAIDDRSGGE